VAATIVGAVKTAVRCVCRTSKGDTGKDSVQTEVVGRRAALRIELEEAPKVPRIARAWINADWHVAFQRNL